MSGEPKEDDSESIASDESDEMTEVDEDDADTLRASYIAEMKELEAQFTLLKEELINEKQILIDQKLKELEEETAEEFIVPVRQLQQNMEMKINLATLLHDYRVENVEHTFKYEKDSNTLSLQNDKILLYDTKMARLEQEIRQLEESRRQLLLDYNMYQMSQYGCLLDDSDEDNNANDQEMADEETNNEDGMVTRRSKKINNASAYQRQSNPPSRSPPAPGAYIVYSLHEYDILEDCFIIKMHTEKGNSSSLPSPSNSKTSVPTASFSALS